MTSREIAELTGKRHDHVLADIRNMFSLLNLPSPESSPEFSGHVPVTVGKGAKRLSLEFRLPKDLTITLVSGYSVPMRHRIVTRWLPGAPDV